MYRIYPHSKIPQHKEEILALRRKKNARGRPTSYFDIALELNFSQSGIWRWVKRWES